MDFQDLLKTIWESDTLKRSVDALIILSLAGFLGGVIGFEREHSHRPAGFRTHILVAVGSALVMLTSVYIFEAYKGQTNLDPARLGAQVISGIGFLGAGTILREGFSVKGLTTAASLWAVSCVGIAAGIGYYEGAIVATIFIVITLNVLKRIMTKSSNGKAVDIIVKDISSVSKKLNELISDMGGVLQSLEIMNSEKNEGVLSKKNKEEFILKALIITKNERLFKTITEEILALDGVEEIYVD
jgi:putative Mg2+ transporter-C (MgtC) family protein